MCEARPFLGSRLLHIEHCTSEALGLSGSGRLSSREAAPRRRDLEARSWESASLQHDKCVTKMSIMTPNITWQDPWPSTHHPSLCLLLQTCRGQINVIKYYEISLDQKVIYLLLIDIYNLKFSAVVGAGTSLEFGSCCRSVVEFRGVDAKGTWIWLW